jgi:DNA-binding transcriptional ArsR family regulator
VGALRSLPPVAAQNCLMRLGDREIALSMMYMRDRDRAELLALLPDPKARRILAEIALHRRLVIRYDQYVAAVEHVLAGLEERSRGAFRSYLRPRRPDRRT